ncbi:MAG TPA: FecR domain-containing protein [Polyangiaceae bacterium]
MNVPRYASQVARLLSAALGEGSAPPQGDRARGTATIERAILARHRRRGVRLALLAAASFLVFVGAVSAVGRFWRPSEAATASESVEATVSPHGAGALLTPGNSPLREGDRLVAGAGLRVSELGTASLVLSTGTRLELEGDSAVTARTLDAHQRFYLSKGTLEARVAKLHTGQRFVVDTPDAEIEVRGTEFRLEVLGQAAADGCAPEIRTRLFVREGVVEVRANGRIARIGAGSRFPECLDGKGEAAPRTEPAEPSTEALPRVETPPEPASTARLAPEASAARRAKPNDAAASEASNPAALVEQNDLFAEGVAARKRGDTAGALSAYGRLIGKYPNSALVENAMVERMRLFGKGSPEAARREAERYLRRYPAGFAHAEAERVLAGPP